MLCNDPYLTLLKKFGYCVVRLPRADIKPLQVFARKGAELNRLGELTTILAAGADVPLPAIAADGPAAVISGKSTGDISAGIGLAILGSIIGAMGGSKLGLETKYNRAKTVSFEFQQVLEDSVEVAKLDQYLGNADVNPFSRHVAELLEADELYVTTATIKSKQFTVDSGKSSEGALELSIPEIQGIVGGNVKVTGKAETSSKVTYVGTAPLVFGFQAVRLFYDNGRYTAFAPLEPAVGMRALDQAPSDGATRLMTDGGFLRLRADE